MAITGSENQSSDGDIPSNCRIDRKVPSLVEKRVWAPTGIDAEPEVQSDPVAVVLEKAVAESNAAIDDDTDLMTLWEQALDN